MLENLTLSRPGVTGRLACSLPVCLSVIFGLLQSRKHWREELVSGLKIAAQLNIRRWHCVEVLFGDDKARPRVNGWRWRLRSTCLPRLSFTLVLSWVLGCICINRWQRKATLFLQRRTGWGQGVANGEGVTSRLDGYRKTNWHPHRDFLDSSQRKIGS